MRLKRRGPGEVSVVDTNGREVAVVHRDSVGQRWRVAMSPTRVRTLAPADPEFATLREAVGWLGDVQFG